MTEFIRTGGLPIGLPDDPETLKRMIESEKRFGDDKAVLRKMTDKLKRLESEQ